MPACKNCNYSLKESSATGSFKELPIFTAFKNTQKFFMQKALYTLCFFIVIALISCQEQVAERDNSLPEVQPNSFVAFPPVDSSNVTNTNIEHAIPAQPATAALNPEHGQPGHRCDIAVGAPLSSPTTNQSAAPAPPTPVLSSPANAGGSVSLNPPHGEPGHDCAIPVGQPLKG